MQHMQKILILRQACLKSLGIAIYTVIFYQADRNVIYIYFFPSE